MGKAICTRSTRWINIEKMNRVLCKGKQGERADQLGDCCKSRASRLFGPELRSEPCTGKKGDDQRAIPLEESKDHVSN